MELKNELLDAYRSAMLHQLGGGETAVFRGAHRYQYGQGFGDVLRGIWKFAVPLAIRAGKTLFKSGASALKEGASVGDAMKGAIAPALRTVFKHGGRAIGDAILQQPPPVAAQPVHPPLVHQDERAVGTEAPPSSVFDLPGLKTINLPAQSGSGQYKSRRKRAATYHPKKPSKKKYYNF